MLPGSKDQVKYTDESLTLRLWAPEILSSNMQDLLVKGLCSV